jgi:hypothetical protein
MNLDPLLSLVLSVMALLLWVARWWLEFDSYSLLNCKDSNLLVVVVVVVVVISSVVTSGSSVGLLGLLGTR